MAEAVLHDSNCSPEPRATATFDAITARVVVSELVDSSYEWQQRIAELLVARALKVPGSAQDHRLLLNDWTERLLTSGQAMDDNALEVLSVLGRVNVMILDTVARRFRILHDPDRSFDERPLVFL
eukprot:3402545-Heterocapsa_arctica.AAC.1